MRRDMIVKLRRTGVLTVTDLASSVVGDTVPGMGQPTADRLRHQARLQVAARADRQVRYELLPAEDGRGLLTLPEPSPGDLFFDLEGDPWAADGGLEYLFGVVDADGAYRDFWAHTPAEEQRSFEAFVDLVTDRLEKYPDLPAYHFAPYEV